MHPLPALCIYPSGTVDMRRFAEESTNPSTEPRPGGVEVQRPPLGGKNEGSIPVVCDFFFVVVDSHRGKRESVSKHHSQLSLFVDAVREC